MAKIKSAIIAYDVTCNKRRRLIQRKLSQWRLQGQYSLVECQLTLRQAEDLLSDIMQLINPEEDKLLLAWLNPQKNMMSLGSASIGFHKKTRFWC